MNTIERREPFAPAVRETVQNYVYAREKGNYDSIVEELRKGLFPVVEEVGEDVMRHGPLKREEAERKYRDRLHKGTEPTARYPQLHKELEDVVDHIVLPYAYGDMEGYNFMCELLEKVKSNKAFPARGTAM
jgi:hypothetical protein